METKEKLKEIVEWLDESYNQESEDYNIFTGPKPDVIRYNENTAISLWACGAVVCINSILYFISENDGNWRVNEEEDEYGDCGYQSSFSIGWVDSFTKALTNLKKYVEENGTPVYFSGTNTICHYTL